MSPPTPTPLAYRVNDAARLIGLGRSTLWRLIAAGKVPVRRVGGSTLIRHEDLQALLAEPQN